MCLNQNKWLNKQAWLSEHSKSNEIVQLVEFLFFFISIFVRVNSIIYFTLIYLIIIQINYNEVNVFAINFVCVRMYGTQWNYVNNSSNSFVFFLSEPYLICLFYNCKFTVKRFRISEPEQDASRTEYAWPNCIVVLNITPLLPGSLHSIMFFFFIGVGTA